jgi:hypothetical protein
MPYVNLENLSKPDTAVAAKMQWLITHLSFMFSSRERRIGEK